MKWQPEHFPKGTVVEYCIGNPEFNQTKTAIVQSIVQNGVDSYCIQTDTWNPALDIQVAFNIDHVTKIISRGKGPMTFRTICSLPVDKMYSTPMIRKAKNRYQCRYDINSYVVMVIDRIVSNHGKIIDFDKIWKHIHSIQNPLGIRYRFIDKDIGIYVSDVSKKKVKRWVLQNINRFLKKKSVAIEEEQGLYHASLDTSFNRELEWREPLQNGSFYLDDGY